MMTLHGRRHRVSLVLRRIDAARWLRIGLRTAHLAFVAFLVGGVAAGLNLRELPWAMWGTLATGLMYVAVELLTSRVWLVQLKGLAVVVKLALFGAMILATGHPLPYLMAALVIGGISSHMPRKYRHYSFWHGRVIR